MWHSSRNLSPIRICSSPPIRSRRSWAVCRCKKSDENHNIDVSRKDVHKGYEGYFIIKRPRLIIPLQWRTLWRAHGLEGARQKKAKKGSVGGCKIRQRKEKENLCFRKFRREAVSYTHLDVYKRQRKSASRAFPTCGMNPTATACMSSLSSSGTPTRRLF